MKTGNKTEKLMENLKEQTMGRDTILQKTKPLISLKLLKHLLHRVIGINQ